MSIVKSLFSKFLSMIEIMLKRTNTIGFTQKVRESRFSDGKSCLHGNRHRVVRNGRYYVKVE